MGGAEIDALARCLEFCATSLEAGCLSPCLHQQGWSLHQASGLPTWASILLATCLIPLSALFSGLTLGLLSLGVRELQIYEQAGEPDEQEYARKIIPVRRNGNLLLCTLLLGTTLVNNAISIVLADVTSGVVGLVIATVAILIFGEIIPQAVCTRHGLMIGAQSASVVRFFIVLFLPITWPMSVLLNAVLGRDIGTVYSREELKRLIELHVTDPEAQAESGLTVADHRLLMGALEYKDKRVRDVMTELGQVFMLERSTRLSFQQMLAIYRSGFTRIPVFEGTPQHIVGILYAKDLILIDPDDEVEVGTVMAFRSRQGYHILDSAKLDTALQHFLASGNHMLIAHRPAPRGSGSGSGAGLSGGPVSPLTPYDPHPAPEQLEGLEVSGVITLEDVLEELLKVEIVDETDNWEDVNLRKPRTQTTAKSAELDAFLAMFEHKLSSARQLGAQEVQAVCAFLSLNVEEFSSLARNEVALKGLVRHAEVIEHTSPAGSEAEGHQTSSRSPTHSCGSVDFNNALLGPASQAWEGAAAQDPQLQLYQRGRPSDYFTLILQGRVLIHTCAENFQFELGPWSVLGNRALAAPQDPNWSYVADFDALALPPCRLLRISRATYLAALKATQISAVIGSHTVRAHIRSALAVREGEEGAMPSGAGWRSPPALVPFDGVEAAPAPGDLEGAASSPHLRPQSPSRCSFGRLPAAQAGGSSAAGWAGRAAGLSYSPSTAAAAAAAAGAAEAGSSLPPLSQAHSCTAPASHLPGIASGDSLHRGLSEQGGALGGWLDSSAAAAAATAAAAGTEAVTSQSGQPGLGAAACSGLLPAGRPWEAPHGLRAPAPAWAGRSAGLGSSSEVLGMPQPCRAWEQAGSGAEEGKEEGEGEGEECDPREGLLARASRRS